METHNEVTNGCATNGSPISLDVVQRGFEAQRRYFAGVDEVENVDTMIEIGLGLLESRRQAGRNDNAFAASLAGWDVRLNKDQRAAAIQIARNAERARTKACRAVAKGKTSLKAVALAMRECVEEFGESWLMSDEEVSPDGDTPPPAEVTIEIAPSEPSTPVETETEVSETKVSSPAVPRTKDAKRWRKLSRRPTWDQLRSSYEPRQLDALEAILAKRPATYEGLESIMWLPAKMKKTSPTRVPFLLSDADPRCRSLDDRYPLFKKGSTKPNTKGCDVFDKALPFIVAALAENPIAKNLVHRVNQLFDAKHREGEEQRREAHRRAAAEADQAEVTAAIAQSDVPTAPIIFGIRQVWPPKTDPNLLRHANTSEQWRAMVVMSWWVHEVDSVGQRAGDSPKGRAVIITKWISYLARAHAFPGGVFESVAWVLGQYVAELHAHADRGGQARLEVDIPPMPVSV